MNKRKQLPYYKNAKVVGAGIEGHFHVVVESDGWGDKEFVLATCYSGDDADLLVRLLNRRAQQRPKAKGDR